MSKQTDLLNLTDAITVSGSNVGIGTDSPDSRLTVQSPDNTLARDIFKLTSLNGAAGLKFGYQRIEQISASTPITFDTGGSESMRIDSSGNVGIGTSSPQGKLEVSGDVYINGGSKSTDAALVISAGAAGTDGVTLDTSYYGGGYGPLKLKTGGSERMRIDSSGRVMIGNTVASSMYGSFDDLVVGSGSNDAGMTIYSGSTAGTLAFADSTSGDGRYRGWLQYVHNNDAMSFGTSATERMRIGSSGNLLFGVTSSLTTSSASGLEIRSNGQLRVGGSAAVDNVVLSTGTTGTKYFISHYQNGTYVGAIIGSGVGLSFSSASDYRLKENVSAMTGATERLKQLNPSRFNFLSAPDTTVDGFLAHEVQAVVPEAVVGTKDAMRDEEYEVTPAAYEDVVIPAVLDEEGNELEAERTEQQLVTEAVMGTRSVPDYQGIDQSKLVPLLTAALQEALTEIADLKARVTALEAT